MKRVLTAAALVPVVLLIVFRAPLWLFSLAIAGIIVLTLREYLDIVAAAGIKPFRCLTYLTGLFLPALFWYSFAPRPKVFRLYSPFLHTYSWWMPLLLTPVIFGIPLVFRKDLKMGLAASASSSFGVFYIAGSLAMLVSLRADPFLATLIIFILFTVWAGDIAAYYVGKNIGRHKLAPVVSPNKSWEGAIASIFASVAVSWLVLHFHSAFDQLFSSRYTFYPQPENVKVSVLHIAILGILTNVAAQFGDLFESALKRGAGVKDSGTLLPGHGGILDRIDALLFAIPVVWYYANLTRFLHPNS